MDIKRERDVENSQTIPVLIEYIDWNGMYVCMAVQSVTAQMNDH
jgi:hypothetical protein